VATKRWDNAVNLFELFGWAAAGLTFLTYSQKTMYRLRIVGIAANCCFIVWATALSIYPVLLLHLASLPVNAFRLYQLLRLKRQAATARHGVVSPLDWLRSLAKSTVYQDGAYVFRKGDPPDRLYYLVSGTVVFDEHNERAGPGEIFGEVAFLTSQRERTSSARCDGPCQVLALDEADLARLSLQHPAFNFYIMRVIAERLTHGPIPTDTPDRPFSRTP
jgi:hypothetical protein